ncbi:hypothetical protein ACET3X_004517 [Alternaria dauci]|uniref:Uncharacterized protein n=1 Tax=Alternaria dauci TaxID=48095 RepID=A0ABR3UN51_9PLEO
MDDTADTPGQKRQKMSLFDNSRARNGGNSTSFVSTSTTGIMDTTFGSTTDEEDDDDMEQYYLNKMSDDSDRKVETVFGRGIDVWKSFDGTVYADVNDKIKKQRRDEEVWGKKKEKRKRVATTKDKTGESLEQRYDSLRNSTSSGSTSTLTPDHAQSTYSDATVSYPSLPLNDGYQKTLPRTPTASEWEIFPVRQSQYNDIPGTPLEYKSIKHPLSNTETTVTNIPGSFDRPIKPLPTRAQRSHSLQSTPTASYHSLSTASQPPTGVFRTAIDGARRIVSGSFGSFDGEQVDRFAEREYRLLPGQMGEAGGKSRADGDGGQDAKPDKFKGRPCLMKA